MSLQKRKTCGIDEHNRPRSFLCINSPCECTPRFISVLPRCKKLAAMTHSPCARRSLAPRCAPPPPVFVAGTGSTAASGTHLDMNPTGSAERRRIVPSLSVRSLVVCGGMLSRHINLLAIFVCIMKMCLYLVQAIEALRAHPFITYHCFSQDNLIFTYR